MRALMSLSRSVHFFWKALSLLVDLGDVVQRASDRATLDLAQCRRSLAELPKPVLGVFAWRTRDRVVDTMAPARAGPFLGAALP
ncbi:hypothetical protein ASC95_14250 [Pelomonas sp. Root1217]|nr:hypothetical protein ASC95_14250 [Pelomonas sp. Root1217]